MRYKRVILNTKKMDWQTHSPLAMQEHRQRISWGAKQRKSNLITQDLYV